MSESINHQIMHKRLHSLLGSFVQDPGGICCAQMPSVAHDQLPERGVNARLGASPWLWRWIARQRSYEVVKV